MIQFEKNYIVKSFIFGVFSLLIIFGCTPNYINLGNTYLKSKNYEQAIDSFSKAKELDPSNWIAYNRLGRTYYDLKKYDDAISQFTISLNIREKGDTHLGLGCSYVALQKFEKALTHFLKFKKLDPSNWIAYNRLGWTYFNLKKYDDAITQFKTANNLKEVLNNYTGLGKSYLELGDYENADTAFSNAFKTTQDDYEKEGIKISWASGYVAQGKYQKAYDILGQKPYLGISVSAGDDGINIVKVEKGSPASLAGLKPGDIMTNFGGNNLSGITTEKFVKEIVRKAEFGSEAIVQIKRDGLYLEKKVTVGITPYMAKTDKDRKHRDNLVKREESKKGVRWAVIIGISNYQDTQIPSLRYAASDAKAFYNWAISPDGGKYAPSQVKLLLDENATGVNIKKALFEWLRGALIEDMVTIYFAGHGSPESPDSQNNLFLLPCDTQYSSIATTGFPMWDIETALKRFIKAKKVVVIADACHSGGVGLSFDIARRSNRGIKVNPISW
jgi:tetratricopeptide (TPR) repeat protein